MKRFDLDGKSFARCTPHGTFVTYADHVAESDRRHQQATDYYRQTMDKCLRDGLEALRGTVCTPERGYIEDGGFNQFIADVKEAAEELRLLRERNSHVGLIGVEEANELYCENCGGEGRFVFEDGRESTCLDCGGTGIDPRPYRFDDDDGPCAPMQGRE